MANKEMSVRDSILPKFYKGYDIDNILDKIYDPISGKKYDNPSVTEDEQDILDEVYDIYYSIENTRKQEEQEKHYEELKRRQEMGRAEAKVKGIPGTFHPICINNPFVLKNDPLKKS